jgi:uncharacterized membrane protein YfcA
VGYDITHAVPLTLIAGMGHWWLGSVYWPLLPLLLTGSIPGIIVGSYLPVLVPDTILRPILAATLVAVGARLVFRCPSIVMGRGLQRNPTALRCEGRETDRAVEIITGCDNQSKLDRPGSQ